jgi:hypothetical protein
MKPNSDFSAQFVGSYLMIHGIINHATPTADTFTVHLFGIMIVFDEP